MKKLIYLCIVTTFLFSSSIIKGEKVEIEEWHIFDNKTTDIKVIERKKPVTGIYNCDVKLHIKVKGKYKNIIYYTTAEKAGITTQTPKKKISAETDITIPARENDSNNVNVIIIVTSPLGKTDKYVYPLKIDCTNPEVKIEYKQNSPYNQCYFSQFRQAVITVTERNFSLEKLVVGQGRIIGVKKIVADNPDQNKHIITVIYEKDGIYDLKFRYEDNAGNKCNRFDYGRSICPEYFIIDKKVKKEKEILRIPKGTPHKLQSKAKKILKKKTEQEQNSLFSLSDDEKVWNNSYLNSIPQIQFLEESKQRIRDVNIVLTVKRNNEIHTVLPSEFTRVESKTEDEYKYTYSLAKELFPEDGKYSVALQSMATMQTEELTFVVDRKEPVCHFIDVKSGDEFYNEQQEICFLAKDESGLKLVSAKVDDKDVKVEQVSEYIYRFMLNSKETLQCIEITACDMAGNISTCKANEIGIFKTQKQGFIIVFPMLGGVGLIMFVIVYRRKKSKV